MNRISVRVRVTAAFAVAMAAVLSGSGWFLYDRLDAHVRSALDVDLQLRSQDLAAFVQQPHASLAHDSSGRFIEAGESYAQLLDPDGHVLQSTKLLGPSALLTAAQAREATANPTYATRPEVPGLNEPSRLLATAIDARGSPAVLVVGATMQNIADTLTTFRRELLLAGPIALVLASAAGYYLAGLALRQVEAIRRRAATISAQTPGERLPVPRTSDEIERLAQTLNDMLARLEHGLERERDFVADAGHELRTPLALLRTELELADRHAESAVELKHAVRAASTEVDRLAQLADHLLLIASIDRGTIPLRLETTDVAEVAQHVVSRFEWRAASLGRTVVSDVASDLQVHADRLRLEQALSNLVDNALRHAAGTIAIAAFATDRSIAIHVRDQGSGFPPGYLDGAFERFSMPGHGRSATGTGLGLSIVRAIARAHGGDAHAANDPSGGADVWLLVPIRSDSDTALTNRSATANSG
jgi:two-component system OmpR family sensor kinase